MIWPAAIEVRINMGKLRSSPIYTSPTDVAQAFYRAFEARNLEAMMAVWADDEEIVCVHPGGSRLVGYDAVRHGWEQLFASGQRLAFRLEQVVPIETVGLATHSAIEHITVLGENNATGTATCTNVFVRTPNGWRMILHHSSLGPPLVEAQRPGPLH